MTGLWTPRRRDVPASLCRLGVTAYYAANYPAANEPYQDFAYTGANLCTDPGCDNVALWSNYNTSTLTNEAGGHTGNWMKVLKAGAAGAAYQADTAVGQRFFVNFWGQTDGAASLSAGDGASLSNIIGLANPGLVWTQYTKTNFLSTFASFYLAKNSIAGNYAGFDDVDIHRLPILTQSNSIITGGAAITQGGAAGLRPTYLPLAAALAQGLTAPTWQLDAVGQRWTTTISPAAYAALTVGGWFYLDATGLALGATFFGSRTGASVFSCLHIGTVLSFYGSGIAVSSGALSIGWHHIVAGCDGLNQWIWLDGVPNHNALGGALPADVLDFGAYNYAGAHSQFLGGCMANIFVAPTLLTTDKIATIRALTRPQGV